MNSPYSKESFYKLKKNALTDLFIFACAGSLLLRGLFSCGEQGLLSRGSAQDSHCYASVAAEHGSGVCGRRTCGSWALEHRLSCGPWA